MAVDPLNAVWKITTAKKALAGAECGISELIVFYPCLYMQF